MNGETVEISAHVLYEILAAGDHLARIVKPDLGQWRECRNAYERWKSITRDDAVQCVLAQHGPQTLGRAEGPSSRRGDTNAAA